MELRLIPNLQGFFACCLLFVFFIMLAIGGDISDLLVSFFLC